MHEPELFLRAGFAIPALAIAACGGCLFGYALATKRYRLLAVVGLLFLTAAYLVALGVVLK